MNEKTESEGLETDRVALFSSSCMHFLVYACARVMYSSTEPMSNSLFANPGPKTPWREIQGDVVACTLHMRSVRSAANAGGPSNHVVLGKRCKFTATHSLAVVKVERNCNSFFELRSRCKTLTRCSIIISYVPPEYWDTPSHPFESNLLLSSCGMNCLCKSHHVRGRRSRGDAETFPLRQRRVR